MTNENEPIVEAQNEKEPIVEQQNQSSPEMVMDTDLELVKERKEDKITKNSKEIRYIKPDCPEGYITDKDEIERYKYKQRIDIMKNRLLGDYNELGEYILSKEIIYELQNAKKEVIEQYKTYLFLHSIYPIQDFGRISFFVSVSKLDDGKLKARLVLLEKIDRINGMVTDTISVVIDEFVDEASPTYYGKMKDKFKIITVDQKNLDDENEEDFKYCRIRKIEMFQLWEQNREEIERKEKEKYEKTIKVLESLKDKNPYAKAILEQLKREREKAKIFIEGKNDKNLSQNTLIDIVISQFSGNPNFTKEHVNEVNSSINPVRNTQAEIKKLINFKDLQARVAKKEQEKGLDKNKTEFKEAFIPGLNVGESFTLEVVQKQVNEQKTNNRDASNSQDISAMLGKGEMREISEAPHHTETPQKVIDLGEDMNMG